MDRQRPPEPRPNTLRQYFWRSMREAHRRRPISFYLMFAILAVVCLGGQVVYVRDDPKRFATFLALNFIVFGVIAARAIMDFFDIARAHFREREVLFRTTLGEEEFVRTLGNRVAEHRDTGPEA